MTISDAIALNNLPTLVVLMCKYQMMKIPQVLFIILLVISVGLSANAQKAEFLFSKEKLAIKVSYHGELVLHPGLAAGVQLEVFQRKNMSLVLDAELGSYLHQWNHSGHFVRTLFGAKFYANSFFFEPELGLGYLFTVPHGDVYSRAANQQIEPNQFVGYSKVMPSLSFLFGWDGTRQLNSRISMFLGPEISFEIPYNNIALPHMAVKAGLTYKLQNPES